MMLSKHKTNNRCFHTKGAGEKHASRHNKWGNLFCRSASQSALTLRLPIHSSTGSWLSRASLGPRSNGYNQTPTPETPSPAIKRQRTRTRRIVRMIRGSSGCWKTTREERGLGMRIERDGRKGAHGRALRSCFWKEEKRSETIKRVAGFRVLGSRI